MGSLLPEAVDELPPIIHPLPRECIIGTKEWRALELMTLNEPHAAIFAGP